MYYAQDCARAIYALRETKKPSNTVLPTSNARQYYKKVQSRLMTGKVKRLRILRY